MQGWDQNQDTKPQDQYIRSQDEGIRSQKQDRNFKHQDNRQNSFIHQNLVTIEHCILRTSVFPVLHLTSLPCVASLRCYS